MPMLPLRAAHWDGFLLPMSRLFSIGGVPLSRGMKIYPLPGLFLSVIMDPLSLASQSARHFGVRLGCIFHSGNINHKGSNLNVLWRVAAPLMQVDGGPSHEQVLAVGGCLPIYVSYLSRYCFVVRYWLCSLVLCGYGWFGGPGRCFLEPMDSCIY